MSLNNIELKPQLLADLYRNTLVESGTTTVPEMKLPGLGENRKNILVLVSHSSFPFLPDEELNFLTSILSACKLSLADIAVVNHAKTNAAEVQKMHSNAGTVLMFGIEPSSIDLPINFPQFQLQQFNKRNYLHAPSLSLLEKDKAEKLKLWNALKRLFEI
jgi:hypothetical protein